MFLVYTNIGKFSFFLYTSFSKGVNGLTDKTPIPRRPEMRENRTKLLPNSHPLAMIPALHRLSAGGKEDSPMEHTTLPSHLHNFNFKSWGTQRHLRRCTNLHTRKPTTNTEPTSISPWNLRAKRADQGEEKRGEVTGEVMTSPIEEKFVERRVFCVTLLREEIEEDVYAMKGTRPTRRPRKRPRGVQHQLDMLFPGCFLTEITLDTYKVVE